MAAAAPGMTVGEARRALAAAFRAAGADAPEADARLLVGCALRLGYAALVAAGAERIDAAQADAIDALASRRIAREPVARILGVKEFWGLALHVAPETLVPRPETETLVEAALAPLDAEARRKPLRVADLGTGTGALLLALLHELPQATGVATDISEAALATARDNAARLGFAGRADFVRCDFAEPPVGRFDIVVSNPPYIATGEIGRLPPEVRHDPRRALDGGADGLDCYRAIAVAAPRLLQPQGRLIVELGVGQEPGAAAIFRAAGLVPSPAVSDLAGIPRALPATLPP